jgi:hypothetical protein
MYKAQPQIVILCKQLLAAFTDIRANPQKCKQRTLAWKPHKSCFNINSFKQWDYEICKKTTQLPWMQSCYQVTIFTVLILETFSILTVSWFLPYVLEFFFSMLVVQIKLCVHIAKEEKLSYIAKQWQMVPSVSFFSKEKQIASF